MHFLTSVLLSCTVLSYVLQVPTNCVDDMSEAAQTKLSPAAVVGIAIGAGALLTLVLIFISVKLYKRRRNSRNSSRRDDYGPQQFETIEVPAAKTLYGRNLRSPGNAPDRYGPLNSNENIHHVYRPSLSGTTHPAFQAERGVRPQMSSAIRFFNVRRSSSKDRRAKALSAIIESPQGHHAGTPSASTAYIHVDPPSRAQSDIIAEGSQLAGNGEDLSPEGSPQSPWGAKAKKYPLGLGTSPISKLQRPLKAVRSKSAGTFSPGPPQDRGFTTNDTDPMRPHIRQRSISFGSTLVGPAPAGPLPPLPSNLSLAAPASLHDQDTSEGERSPVNTTLDENWSKIPLGLFSGGGGVQALYMSRGSTRFSRDSTHSTASSISSIRTSLDDRTSNRLSIPRIEMAERLSVSRVSSSGSVQTLRSDGGLRMVSAPVRRRIAGTQVTSFGSPTGKKRVMREVSGNASTLQVRVTPSKDDALTSGKLLDFDPGSIAPKPSAMKGSPGSRKGHKRQNCVRISTLAPTVLGYARSRSSSPFSMDEIREEGDEGACAETNDRQHKANQLRASLTPTSTNLPMSALQYEQDTTFPTRTSPPSFRFSAGIYKASSPLNNLDLPSYDARVSAARAVDDADETADPPAMIFTRPSSEWDQDELSSSPPFALYVTPTSALPRAYDREKTGQSTGRDHERSNFEGTTNIASGDDDRHENVPPCSPKSIPAFLPSSPPLVDAFSPTTTSYLDKTDASGMTGNEYSPGVSELRRDSDKENAAPRNQPHQILLPSAAGLPSPFKSAPILRPRSSMDVGSPHQQSPTPSRPSSPSPRPPIPRRNANRKSVLQAGKVDSSGVRKTSPSRDDRLGGPRPAPPRDLRRAIIELRRGNSEMLDFSDMSDLGGLGPHSKYDSPSRGGGFPPDGLAEDDSTFDQDLTWGEEDQHGGGRGNEIYLNLGREVSPVLPFTEQHIYDNIPPTPTSTYSTTSTTPGFDFGFDIRPLSFLSNGHHPTTPRSPSAALAQTDFELGLADDPPLDVMLEPPERAYSPFSSTSTNSDGGASGAPTRDELPKPLQSHGYLAYSPLPTPSGFPHRRDGDVDDLVMTIDPFFSPTVADPFEQQQHDFLTPIREGSLEPASSASPAATRQTRAALQQHQRGGRDSSGSVWDDGERYWAEIRPQGSSPSRLDTLRSPRGEVSGGSSLAVSGGGGGRTPERGLYDDSGFLRSSPLRQVVL